MRMLALLSLPKTATVGVEAIGATASMFGISRWMAATSTRSNGSACT